MAKPRLSQDDPQAVGLGSPEGKHKSWISNPALTV